MTMRKYLTALSVFFGIILFVNGIRILNFIDSTHREKNGNIRLYTEPGPNNNNPDSVARDYNDNIRKPVNLAIMGMDEEGFRSDVIVIMNYSSSDGGLNILSVARDTRVLHDGRYMKINALISHGGEELLLDKIFELTGIQVQYYVTLNFSGFRSIIDALDGVRVYVPMDMNYDDPEQRLHIHLKKGWQTLNGKKAEQFVRYRKGNRSGEGYSDGDIGRIKVQQEIIKNLLQQKLKPKYLTRVNDIVIILRKHMRTNVELKDINLQIQNIGNLQPDRIRTYTIPGEAGYIHDTWYFLCDVKKTRELVNKYFYK